MARQQARYQGKDVSDTLQLALEASGLESVNVNHRPRLLSDNGPSYVSAELKGWLDEHGMSHTRSRRSESAYRRVRQLLQHRALLRKSQ
jgi:transposase InsO family protein